jgi:uncharacterized damage-inducible protein DinB
MDENLLHKRLCDNMQKNIATLGNILKTINQAQATSWRDGSDGWTILEVVCHLRDYDGYFLERGQLMLASDHPTYPVYDHLALVVDHAYNEQDLKQVFATLSASRDRFVAFFNNLTEEQWQRTGNHVEHGCYTIEALAAHVSWHDANHLEQITRLISENS